VGAVVRSVPLVAFLFVVGPLIVLGIVGMFAGLRQRRRAAIVAATPTTPIGMTPDGYREFEGRVEAVGGPILAPLTDAPCCWFRARVEETQPRRRRRNQVWILVREWTSNAPFLVRDASGVCVVEPRDAEVTATDRSVWYGATDVPSDRRPPRVKPDEAVPGHVLPGRPDTKYRYFEERIYAGDPLLVLGEYSTGRFASGTSFAAPADADRDRATPTSISGVASEPGEPDEQWRRRQAREITRGTIASGSRAQPFLIATTPHAEHLARTARVATTTLRVAAIPLGIAAVLVWLRFG
jgi:hypothetical protein